MKLILLVAVSLLVLAVASSDAAQVSTAGCVYGRAQAFAAIRANPPYLVGTIPREFTSDTGFFSRRYNCKRTGVQVRRIDLGIYDVRFPELSYRLALVSAISQEGVASSVAVFDNGIYRVTLRGPVVANNDVLVRRDVPFSIVAF